MEGVYNWAIWGIIIYPPTRPPGGALGAPRPQGEGIKIRTWELHEQHGKADRQRKLSRLHAVLLAAYCES